MGGFLITSWYDHGLPLSFDLELLLVCLLFLLLSFAAVLLPRLHVPQGAYNACMSNTYYTHDNGDVSSTHAKKCT